MFESLSEKFQALIQKFGFAGRLTEKNIQDGIREVKLALLEADVNYKVVRDFIDRVTQKAIGQEVIKTVKPSEQIVKIFYDELVALMGPVDATIQKASEPPTIFMMVGLQGSGKTTTCVKLGKYLEKKKFRPLLVAADVQRPAAIEQLKILAQNTKLDFYSENSRNPIAICENSISHARKYLLDSVIIDTQGRLHIDETLMNELRMIKNKLKPHYILLVVDAMTGQDAVNSAKAFNDALDINGVILTKMDGDARGGAALSIKSVTGKPVKFIGTGEKWDNIEEFFPDRMATRILGMGDVVSLVEKAQESLDIEKAKKLEAKIKKADLNLQDFLDQLQQIRKMGPLKELLSMLPFVGKFSDQVDEDQLKKVEAIILSMTPKERRLPEIIDSSRRRRIAAGSGVSEQDVSNLLKQFREMKRVMKDFKKFFKKASKGGTDIGDFGKMMRKLK